MKSYSFSKVSARGYLTEADYNNKYIITEDLKMIINVSGKDFEKPAEFFQERDIKTKFLPLTEKNGDMGYHKILEAVKQGKRCIVGCAFGVNRSRTVIEAVHYAKMGFHFEDDYDGFINHLVCNCETGCLPSLSQVEQDLKKLAENI